MPSPDNLPLLSEVVDGVTIVYDADAGADGGIRVGDTVARETTAELDIYVSPSGDDANDGLTTSTPVQTAVAADALIPLVIRHAVRVHLRSGSIGCARAYWLRGRHFQGGSIEVYADESWDSGVYSVIASGTAGASTTTSLIKGTFSSGAHALHFVKVTSGAGSGRLVSVRNNTTTDLVLDEAVTGLASGVTYQILDWNCTIVPGAADTDFQVALPSSGDVSHREGNNAFSGLILRGFRVGVEGGGSITYQEVHNRAAWIGMRAPRMISLYDEAEIVAGDPNGKHSAGSGLTNRWKGWGITSGDSTGLASALASYGGSFYGYLCANGTSGARNVLGDFARGSLWCGGGANTCTGDLSIAGQAVNVRLLADLDLGHGDSARALNLGARQEYITVKACELVAGSLTFSPHARVELYSTVTGTVTTVIGRDVQVSLQGQPALVTSWDVGDGMPQASTYFDQVGNELRNGSRSVERVA